MLAIVTRTGRCPDSSCCMVFTTVATVACILLIIAVAFSMLFLS